MDLNAGLCNVTGGDILWRCMTEFNAHAAGALKLGFHSEKCIELYRIVTFHYFSFEWYTPLSKTTRFTMIHCWHSLASQDGNWSFPPWYSQSFVGIGRSLTIIGLIAVSPWLCSGTKTAMPKCSKNWNWDSSNKLRLDHIPKSNLETKNPFFGLDQFSTGSTCTFPSLRHVWLRPCTIGLLPGGWWNQKRRDSFAVQPRLWRD